MSVRVLVYHRRLCLAVLVPVKDSSAAYDEKDWYVLWMAV